MPYTAPWDLPGTTRVRPVVEPLTVALIGAREPIDGEADRLVSLDAWLARQGLHARSGGAEHADQQWAVGIASVNPAQMTVCLPQGRPTHSHTAPAGAVIEGPVYPAAIEELAIAEWIFREQLADVGLPPYTDPIIAKRFALRTSWLKLVARQPWTAAAMIRNAAILCPTPTHTVAAVLAAYNPTGGFRGDGGGTGHGVRIAHALGIPVLPVRDAIAFNASRAFLRALGRAAAAGRGRTPAATTTPVSPAPRVRPATRAAGEPSDESTVAAVTMPHPPSPQ